MNIAKGIYQVDLHDTVWVAKQWFSVHGEAENPVATQFTKLDAVEFPVWC